MPTTPQPTARSGDSTRGIALIFAAGFLAILAAISTAFCFADATGVACLGDSITGERSLR